MKLDAHQHFWKYNQQDYSWISGDFMPIAKDFMPKDLKPLLDELGFEGCIAVQARESLIENGFLLDLAEKYDFIKGVVGWVDVYSPDMEKQLAQCAEHHKMVGIRHITQKEEPDFVMSIDHLAMVKCLSKYEFTYDLLLMPPHIKPSVDLCLKFHSQPFVVDHIAKPYIKNNLVEPWRSDLKKLADCENVSCKLSGMVTEADWDNWKVKQIQEYAEMVIEIFGIERVMIGSDWPVSTLGCDYGKVMNIVIDLINTFSEDEQKAILGENCSKFYLG